MEEITSLKEEVKLMIDRADEKTVRMLYAMLEAGSEKDWWDELTKEEKDELEIAIEESNNPENIISMQTFKEEFNSWRNQLLFSKEPNKK